MQTRCRAGRRIIILAAFFILSSMTLFSGLLVCLTKTPESKAEYYMVSANNYINQSSDNVLTPESVDYLLQQSHGMLVKAAQQTPYNPVIWEKISIILSRQGAYQKARDAGDIMGLLGHTGAHNNVDDFLPVKPLILSESLVATSKLR